MMGALAATWAQGESFERAVVVGAAAGAANFLRHGLGGASREVVERLLDSVVLEPLTAGGVTGSPRTIACGATSADHAICAALRTVARCANPAASATGRPACEE